MEYKVIDIPVYLKIDNIVYTSDTLLDGKYVSVGNVNKQTVGIYHCKSNTSNEDNNTISLNLYQRKFLNVVVGDRVIISEFDISQLSVFDITIKSSKFNFPRTKIINDYKSSLQVVNLGEKLTFFYCNKNIEAISEILTQESSIDNTDQKIKSNVLMPKTIRTNKIDFIDNNGVVHIQEQNFTPLKRMISEIHTNTCEHSSNSKENKKYINFDKLDFLNLEVGGLSDEFELIFRRVLMPHILSDKAKSYGIKPVKGVMLYGPPGVGKTRLCYGLTKCLNPDNTIVKLINGPELANKYYGETEKNIRNIFKQSPADSHKLHVYIFDEIDSIGRTRGSSSSVSDTAINQLLTVIDGLKQDTNVIIFGLTNRKDILDPALMRPGRFEIHIYIGLPKLDGRKEIFTVHCKELINNSHMNLSLIDQLAEKTSNFTGAEIESIVKNTKTLVLRKYININALEDSMKAIPTNIHFELSDFEAALAEIQPMFGNKFYEIHSLLETQQQHYENIYNLLTENRKTLGPNVLQPDSNQNKNIFIHGTNKCGKTTVVKNILNNYSCNYKYYLGGRDLLAENGIETLNKIYNLYTKNGLIILDDIEILLSIFPGFYDKNVLRNLLIFLTERQHTTIIITPSLETLEFLGLCRLMDSSYEFIL